MDSSLNWREQASHPDSSSVETLISRCLAGDSAAHGALYKQFAPMIYRLNYNLLQDQQDAEEVLQDSFEYAFRRLDHFDANKSAFKTWLYRIAISRCRNKRRRKLLPTFSITQILSNDEEDIRDQETLSPAEQVRLSEEQQRVWDAVQALSPKLREVAVLRYYDEMRYAEIGNILNISPKTAESRMRLAHKRLRETLREGE